MQKVVLLIAIITLVGHSILPHIHHDEIPVAILQHHQDEQPSGHHPHDDDNNKQDNQHRLFSFAQLDENFVPVNGQAKNFELPLTYVPTLIVNYQPFSINTKTHFSCYKVFSPPEKYFSSSFHRGPPTV